MKLLGFISLIPLSDDPENCQISSSSDEDHSNRQSVDVSFGGGELFTETTTSSLEAHEDGPSGEVHLTELRNVGTTTSSVEAHEDGPSGEVHLTELCNVGTTTSSMEAREDGLSGEGETTDLVNVTTITSSSETDLDVSEKCEKDHEEEESGEGDVRGEGEHVTDSGKVTAEEARSPPKSGRNKRKTRNSKDEVPSKQTRIASTPMNVPCVFSRAREKLHQDFGEFVERIRKC